jgi:hypothetical protein
MSLVLLALYLHIFASCLLSMERVKGIEPSSQSSQPVESQSNAEHPEPVYTQIGAQIQGNDRRDLSQVVNAWAGLPAALKAGILAIVNTARNKEGQ